MYPVSELAQKKHLSRRFASKSKKKSIQRDTQYNNEYQKKLEEQQELAERKRDVNSLSRGKESRSGLLEKGSMRHSSSSQYI